MKKKANYTLLIIICSAIPFVAGISLFFLNNMWMQDRYTNFEYPQKDMFEQRMSIRYPKYELYISSRLSFSELEVAMSYLSDDTREFEQAFEVFSQTTDFVMSEDTFDLVTSDEPYEGRNGCSCQQIICELYSDNYYFKFWADCKETNLSKQENISSATQRGYERWRCWVESKQNPPEDERGYSFELKLFGGGEIEYYLGDEVFGNAKEFYERLQTVQPEVEAES